MKLYFKRVLCRILEKIKNEKFLLCSKWSKKTFKKKEDCADFSRASWYYNNCKNPPIHYIVFATPHKKKYLLQKRQSKDWRFYVIGNLLSYNVKFSGGAHCGGTELCR
ncbi:hypothetical protein DQQ01_13600 [Blautia argi]|uniref:Uncharacterized protein n=1 Tax=Blautia argi TaxID=1912897 RepID=A0A2Z4UDH7_9FIRM|nr:hypothetical protein DQQ01_13600 [Blautia argi]